MHVRANQSMAHVYSAPVFLNDAGLADKAVPAKLLQLHRKDDSKAMLRAGAAL